MNDGPPDDENPWIDNHDKMVGVARTAASEPWADEVCRRLVPALAEEFKVPFSGKYYDRLREVEPQIFDALQEVCMVSALPAQLAESMDMVAESASKYPELAGVLGRVLAEAVIAEPHGAAIARGLIGDNFVALDIMIETMRNAFQTTGQEAVIIALKGVVTDIAKHPEVGLFPREQNGFLEFLRQWKASRELDSVFGHGFGNVTWFYRPIDLVRVLRPLDRSQYLELLEDTALPLALHHEFYAHDVVENLDEILALLCVAPSIQMVDPSGGMTWNGKIAAPILLTVGHEHAVRIGRPKDGRQIDRDEMNRKVHDVFVKLTDVLLEREDGKFLGLQWLGYLIGEEGRRQSRASHQWSPIPTAIDVLTEAMAAKGYGLTDALDAFHEILPSPNGLEVMRLSRVGKKKWGRGTSGTDAFLAAVLLEQADVHGNREFDATNLLLLYRSLLIQRDRGLDIFSDADFPTWRNWQPAALYACLKDPRQEWQDVWQSLSEQRRRSRHVLDDRGADDPSFFHICLGLSLIDWLLTPKFSKPQQALCCWRAVFDATFCMSLSVHFFQANRWRHALAKLFARLPHVLRASNSETSYAIEVARELARLGGDDELLAWCSSMALANGIELQDLAVVLLELQPQKIDLALRLKEFVEWEQRSGIRRPSSGLVGECSRIIRALSQDMM